MVYICTICSDFLEIDDNRIASIPCGHTFHKDCLAIWLETSSKCSICSKNTTIEQAICPIYLSSDKELTGRSKEELEALLVIAKMEKRDKEEAMKDTVIANQALRSELKKYKEMVSSMSVANAEHVNSLVSERNIISAQLQDLTKIKNERDTANAKLSGASAIIKLKQAELDAINAAMKSKPKPPAFGDSSFSIDTTKGFGFGNAAQNSPPAPGFGGFGTRKK